MTTTSTTTGIRSPLDAWVAALNAHDPDAAAQCFTPDSLFVNVGTGERNEGRDAIRAHHVALFAMWSEIAIEKGPYLVDGNRFADEWTMTGVHTGDVPGLPATGKPFRIHGAGTGEVRDGLIARATEYWNMGEFLTQVGLMPAPQD